jgi:hypothetical protein
MEISVPIVGAVSLLCVVPVLRRLGRNVQGTTLGPAWHWALAGVVLWELAWLLSFSSIPNAYFDYLWYSVALLGLCPPITVLGAKRPGARVWAVFVVLPLLLVFAWPAAVGWIDGFPPERLTLETPMLLGYGLVLVMGYGNYLGTRHSLSALMIALSLGWLVWHFAATPEAGERLRPLGPTLIFAMAAVLGVTATTQPTQAISGEDRLWRDFQEAFGIVWAKRIMDRINHTASQEIWSARLEMPGFVWNESVSAEERAHTLSRIHHALRWHLRRFVDPAWIEERVLQFPDISSEEEPRTK